MGVALHDVRHSSQWASEMSERCPYCHLNFAVAKRHLMSKDWLTQLVAWCAYQQHLEECPPIVTREGEERLVDAICDYRQSGRKAGLDKKGGERCGSPDVFKGPSCPVVGRFPTRN